MEKALLLHNKHWNNERYPDLFHRDIFDSIFKKLKLREIHVLLGIRRSGKSTLFKLLINRLSEQVDPKELLYINLDDPFFSDVWKDSKELYRVLDTAEKLTGSKVKFLFLDEIQNVMGWEKFVKSVYDAGAFKKIFITGSNSSLLKGDYAKLLSGRYITDSVYPLSFRECLTNNGIKSYLDLVSNKPKALGLLDDLLYNGSFPEVFKTKEPDLKRELLLNYYETIILKDCVANHNIRDIKTFKELSYYLISNISAPYSYNSLARAVKGNENTVKDFIDILEDSFLLKEVRNFSYSLKTQSKAKKKVYCIDNSFMNIVSFKFSENRGKLLENLVHTEFLKSGYTEVYFYNEYKECDFVLKKGKDLIAVQVSYELGGSNKDREVDGLLTTMRKLEIPKGYIISYDTEGSINENALIIPFWKFYGEAA